MKTTWITTWKEASLPRKMLGIAGIAVSAAIIVLGVLQVAGVTEHADYIYIPGLGVLMLIQAAENWKLNKATAFFSLFGGLFILIIVTVHFLMLR